MTDRSADLPGGTMSQWRVLIDRDVCVGSGTCISTAPAHFALDEEDKSDPRQPVIAADEDVVAAVAMCPTAAIRVLDAASGELVCEG